MSLATAKAFRDKTLPDFVLVATDALKRANVKVVRIGPKNTGIGLDWLTRAEISPKVEKLCVPAAWLLSKVGTEGELPALSPDVVSRLVIEQAEKLRKTTDVGRLITIGQQIQGMSLAEALDTYGKSLSNPQRVKACREILLAAPPAPAPGLPSDSGGLLPTGSGGEKSGGIPPDVFRPV